MYSVKMLARLRGSGRTSGPPRSSARPHAPASDTGSWPTISTRTAIERKREGPQHIRPGGQVAAAVGDLGAQELPHRGDLVADRRQGLRPTVVDEFSERARRHDANQRRSAERFPAGVPGPGAAVDPHPRRPGDHRADRPPAGRQRHRGSMRPARGPRRRRAPTTRGPHPAAAAAAATASRSAVSPFVVTSIPTPEAVARWPQVGDQTVGHVRHGRRTGVGGPRVPDRMAVRAPGDGGAGRRKSADPAVSSAYPAADRPRSPATATVPSRRWHRRG